MASLIIEGKADDALKLARTLWNKQGSKYTEKEMKKMGFMKKKGWRSESARHSLAAKGLKTGKGKRKKVPMKLTFGKKRKFKIGDIVRLYPNVADLEGKGKIVGYQGNACYFVQAISGSQFKEFGGKKKLTYYDFELKKV